MRCCQGVLILPRCIDCLYVYHIFLYHFDFALSVGCFWCYQTVFSVQTEHSSQWLCFQYHIPQDLQWENIKSISCEARISRKPDFSHLFCVHTPYASQKALKIPSKKIYPESNTSIHAVCCGLSQKQKKTLLLLFCLLSQASCNLYHNLNHPFETWLRPSAVLNDQRYVLTSIPWSIPRCSVFRFCGFRNDVIMMSNQN